VSLALFGLAYRAYPQLSQSRLAIAHFVLASIGAIMFPVGIALAISGSSPGVAILGAFIWLVAVVLFLVNLARLAFAPSGSHILMPAE
jgi:hypothetical protein